MRVHIIGGGIAALSAASYLLRDASVMGHNIDIYDASDRLGGALDAAGTAETGYVMRGGRMFEVKEACIHDLLSFVPSGNDPSKSIEVDLLEFNAKHGWDNKARLLGPNGKVLPSESFGLSYRNMLDLAELMLSPEAILDGKSIEDVLDLSILDTNFWNMFGSIFALLPWHSAIETRRYLRRFFHLLPTMSSMTTIQRTRFNQYEAIVQPLRDWLTSQGVTFHLSTTCEDISFSGPDGDKRPAILHMTNVRGSKDTKLGPNDVVFVTLGSHVDDATRGSMTEAPPVPQGQGCSWRLWERLAGTHDGFGSPAVFKRRVEQTGWVTFTITCKKGPLPKLVERLSGSALGRGGLMTLTGSPWLMTLTGFHNPHFANQPPDADILWGYGLYLDRPGSAVAKTMPNCSGSDILTELAHHLGIDRDLPAVLSSCICHPTLLPYAGSVLIQRNKADRAQIVPDGFRNLALLGQFVEVPDEVVFTTEYSIRGARMAVAQIFNTERPPPPVYLGQYDPKALLASLRALRA